ncbi:MAG TPA: glycosyltransferase family 2 protein [Thermoanaerobaculia bacterium]|nr:glycosyltransferase family 2 protein [Thermoanaerobaculia bacterium]
MPAENGNPRIVALVLAWNEEASLPALLAELARDCPGWTIVVVSDGSTDETARCARESGVVVIELSFNSGVAAAEQTGLLWARSAGARVVVRLDGDGQHPPSEARKVVDGLLASGADVAVGSRFLDEGGYRSTRLRRGGIRWLSFLLRVLGGLRITDPTSGLRAFGTRALALLCEVYPDEYPEPESNLLLGRAGLRLVEVPVKMRARDGGHSSLGGWTAIYYPVKVTFALVVEALRRPAR